MSNFKMFKNKKVKGFTLLNKKVGNEIDNNKSAAAGSLKLRKNGRYLTGFTLIELLVVIAIVGLLSTFAVVTLDNARKKARDARRLSDMTQIQKALELYLNKYSSYPNAMSGDGSWEDSTEDGGDFIDYLKDYGYMGTVPVDPTNTSTYRYSYYQYNAGDYGCAASRGKYYVLGIRAMETSTGAYSTSPGWSCPSRNWQTEFAWVAGKFEKE